MFLNAASSGLQVTRQFNDWITAIGNISMSNVTEGIVVTTIQHSYRHLILLNEPQVFRHLRIESNRTSNSVITVCEMKMSVPGKLC